MNAQITELRSAEACSSSCLIRRDSGATRSGELPVGAGIWPFDISNYKQSKEHELGVEVEVELFTHAETAW